MAKLPTEDEKVRSVLDVFEHFGTRPNEALSLGSFYKNVNAPGWRADDINNGIQIGVDRGYFERTPDGSVRLTEAGFAEV